MVFSGDRSARAARSGRGPELVFNFLPVRFGGEALAGTVAYESPEQVAGYRERLSSTHAVAHVGKRIVCAPLVPDAEVVGERCSVGTAGEDLPVVAQFLHAHLTRMLTEKWGYQLRNDDPLMFVSRLQGRDLIEKARQGRDLAGLHVYREYHLDVRRQGPDRHTGLVVGMKTRQEIDLPISELARRGVDVRGLYVLAESDSFRRWRAQDPTVRRKLVGQAVAVSGAGLKVRGRDGEVVIDATRTWIEPTRANFHLVLRRLAGPSYDRVVGALDKEIFALSNAEARLSDMARIAEMLINIDKFEIAVGLHVEIGKPLRMRGAQLRQLTEPTFVFDQGGDKTDQWLDRGLDTFGPLDSESFSPKSPHVAVVVPRQFQGTVETFVRSFRDGVRGSRAYPQGFVRKYRLTDCTFSFTAFDGNPRDATAYRTACRQALDGPQQPQLAMVVTSVEQEHLTGDDSPYLVSKSVFMSQGIPVQEFQIEKISSEDNAHPLSTMALACYAGATRGCTSTVPGSSTLRPRGVG